MIIISMGAQHPDPAPVLRTRLQSDLPVLPPAQRRLATFLLDNFRSASDLGIADLAEEAGVSMGTIAQLSRRLGVRGYQELRLALAREAVTLTTSGEPAWLLGLDEASPEAPDDVRDAVVQVFGAGLEALRQSARGLDRGALQRTVEHLARARRVEWVGAATASLVAQEGALKLRKLGIDALAHADGHQQQMSAALLGPEDVLMAVSHSGRTRDVLRSARLAREGGAHLVAITGAGRSPLAATAHDVLATVAHDTAFQVEPMASTVVQLAVVQLLFLMLLERGGAAAQERLSRTQHAVVPQLVEGRRW
jgi:DNA-binding MurR/RpiR family transcriptional regulator